MKELLRTNDVVQISWVVALLADAHIEALVMDTHSSIVEGSIGAIPRRIMVVDDDLEAARRVLREAGEESGLAVAPLSPRVFDLDVHAIPARRDDPAHHHFDVRFALCADAGQDFVVSGESFDLAWVQVAQLGAYTGEESMLRMRDKWLLREAR